MVTERTTRHFAAAMIGLGFMLMVNGSLMAQGGPPGGRQGQGVPSAGATLTADQSKWILFLREEEKLARDVYRNLDAQWKLMIFDNTAESEQRHFDSVGLLISRYGLEDPALNHPTGVFSDPTLQALYAQLMAKGMISAKDALEVGVLIEERDIGDLKLALGATSKTDIQRVFSNLLKGSLNHLDAFQSHLQVLGVNP